MRSTGGHLGSLLAPRLGALTLVAIATMMSACSVDSPATAPKPMPTHSAAAAPASSPDQLCLRGVHRSPASAIVVNRAVTAPLFRVKAWVLKTAPGVRWSTFSVSLADAPLRERVAVCVITKKDRGTFDPGNGQKPARSIVEIVRPGGEATGFILGTLESNLDLTPTSFVRYQ